MKCKIYYFFIVMVLFGEQVNGQEPNLKHWGLEYGYGINQNPSGNDSILSHFLHGVGRSFRGDVFLQRRLSEVSLIEVHFSANFVSKIIQLPNLRYEFDYGMDLRDSSYGRFPSFLFFSLKPEYFHQFYSSNKIDLFVGGGIGLNFDFSHADGGYHITNQKTGVSRKYWSHYTLREKSRVFGSLSLSTKMEYLVSEKFKIHSKIFYEYAPFQNARFEYVISSLDGIYTGKYSQKLNNASMNIGCSYAF